MNSEVTVPLCTPGGAQVATLTVRCLAGSEEWNGNASILDLRGVDSGGSNIAAPVQLLEEISYDYEITECETEIVEIEPTDRVRWSRSPLSGRLDVGRSTGTLRFEARLAGNRTASCDLEVRSRKLDYETEYRHMLLRIAQESAALVQQHFAASALAAFRPDTSVDSETLYQRFAFVKAVLDSDRLQGALHQIERRPHSENIEVTEFVDPARSVKSTRSLAKQLVRPGDRQRVAVPVAGMETLPRTVAVSTAERTFDTVPNRFVKYVLERWRSIAVDVGRALDGDGPADRRGRREAESLVETIERLLNGPVLSESGRLSAFPESNQVLQGRAGYRDVLEAFLLAESAATIEWDDGDRLFRAGQRNVAALYEYWVFLELVRIVATLPGFTVDKRSLVRRSKSGMSLELRRQGDAVVEARGACRGTTVRVKVWFNRRFSRGAESTPGSTWTVPMYPDCSIQVVPEDRILAADTWIHFDAKYRLHELDLPSAEELESEGPNTHAPLSADLAKMHAYRDGIHRTAGAYVLYPGSDGSDAVRHEAYREILPGLGGFALRPTSSGEASVETATVLRDFLFDAVRHVAAQGTDVERMRYWSEVTRATPPSEPADYQEFLSKPPADTSVLLGFARSPKHREWVETAGIYHLRADPDRAGSIGLDAPELAADFVVVYEANAASASVLRHVGPLTLRTQDELLRLGCPSVSGDRYLCLAVEHVGNLEADKTNIARALARHGRERALWAKPKLIQWEELMAHATDV